MVWRTPEFWRAPPGLAARALWPLGALYGAATAWRMRRPVGALLDKPVICVGNFTAGGAGKTPTVIALAHLLGEMGETPFVVSRGYGGSNVAPLRVDPARHDAAQVGDEPLEIAARAPCVVGRDRVAAARLAVAQGASVVLLDDGLQNPSLRKTFAFAVVDGEAGFGNGYCVPAGPLRAPLAAQRDVVDAVVVIGGAEDARGRIVDEIGAATPMLAARLVAEGDAWRGVRALAFAGVGRPEKFFATLRDCGAEIVDVATFADHRPYADDELRALAARASAAGLTPATTVKDVMRIGQARARAIFGGALRVLPVDLRFDDETVVRGLLKEALARGV